MSRPVANRPTQPVREDAHLPYESTPMPVSAMAASYPHGTWIAPHRHRRAQLLYAIEGVMHVQSDGASWIVPPTRGVWLEAGLDHTVQMSGNVEMRTVFVEPGAVEHLPGRSCVVEVHPLLRELILAAVDVPLDHAPGSRHDHLMRLLLAEVTAAPLLPLYLPWPHDARLRTICDALVAAPDDLRTVAEWAGIAGISVRTLHRGFQRETGLGFRRWREQARLLLALKRLAHGEKVLTVAMDHGYSSQSAFSAMFKRHFGVPPSAFYA
ncbi:AraC family transcriptional regulator [Burkholderia ubonensis]|uniref:AraC family transcriptional regulator n=1 Tax=Burkholderia ubonensis TaxID=101571 RepID=UPI0009B4E019